MTCNQCKPEDCIAPNGWVCKNSGNFYTTGEYANTVDFFGIFGVSFKQKIDSVKSELDYNTLQILKVLLTDYQAPADLDLYHTLHVIATLDFIQSRLSTDNKNGNLQVFNNSHVPGDGTDD